MSSEAGGCCGGHGDHEHEDGHSIEPKVLEDLAALEMELEAAELAALKSQYKLLNPLFQKRTAVIAKIPEFWPRVFSASKDLDALISQNDAQLFEAHLVGLNVVRPEADKEGGEIRNFDITFTFTENPWFEETVLTKRFYQTPVGLASEPLKINWKEGKDLTNGITQKAYDFFVAKKQELEKAASEENKEATKLEAPDWDELVKEEDRSFFMWFSWWGDALNAVKAAAKDGAEKKDGEDSEDEDDEDYDDMEEEDEGVFPGGGDLAGYIVDDLFVNATRYLTESLEGPEDEWDDEELEMLGSDDEEALLEAFQNGAESSKKRKADDDTPKKSTKKSKA
ncbi:hypothetical protein BJ508DRAFT_410788 [Ascobolus immersus RN42]|uniref:NAP-domain-containing protein n=1 Tax=Ascobolus immersus RN42 TaxID=1160509 RepID=A0A3N4IN12_ASCIM|nr:hypothetical protein BJ508DRAFT_410788 [Ascobolus immersus RN42]